MKKVNTVLGPIRPEDLGFTSMHEHVFVRLALQGESPRDDRVGLHDPVRLDNVGVIRRNFLTNLDARGLSDEDMMLGEVTDFKESGGDTLLELSVPGLRNNLPGIKRISEATGVHIIVSTGFYIGSSWPQEYTDLSIEDLKKVMLGEFEHGIEDTGILPGHLKIAITNLTEREEKALRAAGRAAGETGMSLTIHCGAGYGGDGRGVSRILKEEGLDLSRVVIAHVGGSFLDMDLKLLITHPEMWKLNVDYAKEILDGGANISVEFLGCPLDQEQADMVTSPDWVRLAGMYALLGQGYSSQMVMGTDLCAKIMTRRAGGEGYLRLTRYAVPKLLELGISDHDLRMMTKVNPARLLAIPG